MTFNNNQLILKGLIRAMPQLTERNQLMQFIMYIYIRFGFPLSHPQYMNVHFCRSSNGIS